MQGVTKKWLDANKKPIMDECFVEVEIEIVDPEALYTATATANPELEILSDVTDIIKKTNFKKYGTLEENFWLLDGSILWADDTDSNNEPAGYISDSICDDNCTFSTLPIITITPDSVQENAYGITITFSELFDEYATNFEVIFWLNNSLVSNQIVENNTQVVCPVQLETGEFDKIEIRIYKWCLPNRRARVENILVGYKRKFDKNELVDFEIEQNTSLINAVLPENTLNFSIDRTKVDYDINEDDTLSKYFRQRQKVSAKLGIMTTDGAKEFISGGEYFLKEWDFKRGSIKGGFTAKGILSFLNQPYEKGVYYPNGISLSSLAAAVLNDAKQVTGLDFKWYLSTSLSGLRTTAPLPVCTWAECLQYIASAAGCVLSCTRQNEIRITKTPYTGTETAYTIDNSVLYDYPQIELAQELKSITCNIYSCELGETETLYQSVHYVEDSAEIIIRYSESGEISFTVNPYASGDVVLVSYGAYANMSVFQFTGTGYVNIKIEGKPLKKSSSSYTFNLSSTGSEERLQNPIITNEQTAKKACENAISWFKNRSQETFSEFRADPRLDSGNFVNYKNENTLISEIKYSFTGMFRGNCQGRIGYQPFTLPDTEDSKGLDTVLFPDINEDGAADSQDAAIIMQAAVNIAAGLDSGLTPIQEVLADANRDGIIDSYDSQLVLKFSSQCGIGNYEQSPEEWERFLKNEGVI